MSETTALPLNNPPPKAVPAVQRPILVSMESLGFNMKATEPSKSWRKQKFIMLGPGKSGKTKFWAESGDNAFWFRTEAGHNHVKTIGENILDYQDYEKWVNNLFKAKNAGILPFDTIVIDTGDRWVDVHTEKVIEDARNKFTKMEINSIGDIPEGQGWFAQKTKINLALKQLEELNCAIVLIFHVGTDVLNEEGDTKKTYKKETINVGGKTGTAILAWADHILHLKTAYVGDLIARKMLVRGSKTIEAGSRIKDIPQSFVWSDNDADNYKKFRTLFTD